MWHWGSPTRRRCVAAYDAMMASVAGTRPEARLHGVLVQPMAPRGVEMIVSTMNDPVFGPVVTRGRGRREHRACTRT